MELTDLEQQLLDDASEQRVAQLTVPLQLAVQQLNQALQQPQLPKTYQALQRQLQAVAAAQQVIQILAQRYRSDHREC